MIGDNLGNGTAFDPRAILKEIEEVTREAKTKPEAKDRAVQIKARANEIAKLLLKNGVRPDGLTTLALISIAESLRDRLEQTVMLMDALKDAFGIELGAKVAVDSEAVTEFLDEETKI